VVSPLVGVHDAGEAFEKVVLKGVLLAVFEFATLELLQRGDAFVGFHDGVNQTGDVPIPDFGVDVDFLALSYSNEVLQGVLGAVPESALGGDERVLGAFVLASEDLLIGFCKESSVGHDYRYSYLVEKGGG